MCYESQVTLFLRVYSIPERKETPKKCLTLLRVKQFQMPKQMQICVFQNNFVALLIAVLIEKLCMCVVNHEGNRHNNNTWLLSDKMGDRIGQHCMKCYLREAGSVRVHLSLGGM